jgi:RNA polymerase sigma-70 factor (ECF subfamily)
MSVMNHFDASGSTSHTLLNRVRQQEPAAWRRFSELYGPLAYRWCRAAGLQEPDAADVVQEVFRAVFQGIARFQRPERGPGLRGWLYTIARHKICDHFRRLQEEPAADGSPEAHEFFAQLPQLPESDPTSADDYVAELSRRALSLIQTDFEPKTWQAFWAMTVDGRSAAETARQLGLTTAAVFKAKSRVLNRLRRELDGLLD